MRNPTPPPSEILDKLRVPKSSNWYMIGYGATRVTVRTQQIRALNLAWALRNHPTVPKDVIVIGGGAAGLTVAAALATCGSNVVVLERAAALLPLQRNCTKRHLHPHVFDWPEPISDNTDADLPILNWRAGWAREVALTIEHGFHRCASTAEGRLQTFLLASDIDLDSPCTGRVTLRYERTRKVATVAYDALIFALGFGLEQSEFSNAPATYWADDSLDQHGITENRRYLISGTGDGALIDLFRVLFPELRQSDLVQLVRNAFRDKEVELRQWCRELDARTGKLPAEEQGSFLYDEYSRLDEVMPEMDALDKELKEHARSDARVTLLSRAASPFSLRSRPLHRLFFSRVLKCFGTQVSVRCNRTLEPHHCKSGPDGISYAEIAGEPGENFDQVIVRHGPASTVTASFAHLHQRVAEWNHDIPDIPNEQLFPDHFLPSGPQYSGAGGPDINDYLAELNGRNFMAPSVEGKVPASAFSELALELRRIDLDEEMSSESQSTDAEFGSDKEIAEAEAGRAMKSAKGTPALDPGEADSATKNQDPLLHYKDRRRIPVPGFSFVPKTSHWDFSQVTAFRGRAGTGKTTLLKQLIRSTSLEKTPHGEGLVPVVLLQSSLGLLEAQEQIAESIVLAALHSAELSTFSRAHTRLSHLLADPREAKSVRLFVDGVETATKRATQRVWDFAKRQGIQLVFFGRTFPELPSEGRNVRQIEVMGLVPGQERKVMTAHGIEIAEAQTGELPAVPFQVLPYLYFAQEKRELPTSLLEAYEYRLRAFKPEAVETLQAIAKRALATDTPQISMPAAELASVFSLDPQLRALFTGNLRLEFSHLSYGEFLASKMLDREVLKHARRRLRKQESTWENRLDILAMAHARSSEILDEALCELERGAPDPLLTQSSLIFRALQFGGEQARVFLTEKNERLRVWTGHLLEQPSARFGMREVDLARDILEAERVNATSLDLPPMDLAGDPAAIFWCLRGREGRLEHSRTDAHWWQTIFSEANRLVSEEHPLDEVIKRTAGAGSIHRELAVKILQESEARLLATWSERRRWPIAARVGEVPHLIELLTGGEADNRIDCLTQLQEIPQLACSLEEVRSAISAQDPYKGVKLTAEVAVPSKRRAVFNRLLKPKERVTFREQAILSDLIRSEVLAGPNEEQLRNFIASGHAWFLRDEDWSFLSSKEWLLNIIRTNLKDERPKHYFLEAAAKCPELVEELCAIANRLLDDRGKNEDLLASLLSNLPEADPKAQKLFTSILNGPDLNDRVFRASLAKLAACPDMHPVVDRIFERRREPSHIEVALHHKPYARTASGKALAFDVIEGHLDQPEDVGERPWFNAVQVALDSLEQGDKSSEYWMRQYERLLSPSNADSYGWAYRRSSILQFLAPKGDELFDFLRREWTVTPREIVEEPRFVLYARIDWDKVSEPQQAELCNYALHETGHKSLDILWPNLKSVPQVREKIERCTRTDRWDLRYAYFAEMSRTARGREQLLELGERWLNESHPFLEDLIPALSRDPCARRLLLRVLGAGRTAALRVLQTVGDDPEVRGTARDLLGNPKWLRSLPRMGRNEHVEHFQRDPEAQKFLWNEVQSSSPDHLPEEDVVAILHGFPPAREWMVELALGSPNDMNSKLAAMEGTIDDARVKKEILRLIDDPESAELPRSQAIRAAADEPWARERLASLVDHKKEDIRLIAYRAAFRLNRIPTSLQMDDGQLAGTPQYGESLEHEKVRKGLVHSVELIPSSKAKRRDWLRIVGTRDPSDEVRRLAQESLRKADDPAVFLRDASAIAMPKTFEVSEAKAPGDFERCWQWLMRKLVSTLRDDANWDSAPTFLDEEHDVFGEILPSDERVTLIRLAKDASELPRDRSIWPTTNLILAWTMARQLKASQPRTMLLACADLHREELILPTLEPGQIVLGPVFFGFSPYLSQGIDTK